MSSVLLSTLELLQTNNYISVALVTALVYDYLLLFPREVEYIWRRPWTWVSSAYVVVRYIGLCDAILNSLLGSTFVPGPIKVNVSMPRFSPLLCHILYILLEGAALWLVEDWELPIFLMATDLVMIMRVYTMWNRSRRILYFLLLIYVPHIIVSFVFTGLEYILNNNFFVSIVQVVDLSFCGTYYTNNVPPGLNWAFDALRFVLGITLLVLAAIKTLKQSVAMGRATNQWWPNQYTQLFMKDGILYFIANAFNNILFMIQDVNSVGISSTTLLFLFLFSYITLYPIVPRFIISIRELYDRDTLGRRQGVDSGFGMGSQPFDGEVVSSMVFTGGSPGEDENLGGVDDSEAIQLDTLRAPENHDQV